MMEKYKIHYDIYKELNFHNAPCEIQTQNCIFTSNLKHSIRIRKRITRFGQKQNTAGFIKRVTSGFEPKLAL